MGRHFCDFCSEAYNRCKHAHEPGPNMWLSLGPGTDFKSSKTVEVAAFKSDVHFKG